MSEYLSKKAVLEWLKKQQKQQEENRDRLEIDHPYWEYHEGASDYLSLAVEKFESGAFDADVQMTQRDVYRVADEILTLRGENERLRAENERYRKALERIAETDIPYAPMTDHSVIRFYEQVAREALASTPTEPSGEEREGDLIGYWINEKCPKCGADMLVNKVGDKWCSLVGCDYSINAPEKDMSTSKGISFLPQSQTKANKKEACYLCGADTDKGGININGEFKPVCFACLCGLAKWQRRNQTMTDQDREKKLAEIRKELSFIPRGDRTVEYWRENCRFLLSELEREEECTDENPCSECLKMSVEGYKEIVQELEEENRKLREEKKKLIEGLRTILSALEIRQVLYDSPQHPQSGGGGD